MGTAATAAYEMVAAAQADYMEWTAALQRAQAAGNGEVMAQAARALVAAGNALEAAQAAYAAVLKAEAAATGKPVNMAR